MKKVTRTIPVAKINAMSLQGPVDMVVYGAANEKDVRKYCRDNELLLSSYTIEEALYAITMDDFMAHALPVEKKGE